MQRRKFLKSSVFAGFGSLFLPSVAQGQASEAFARKKAKNIIYMVSDGMSVGTLVMADLYSKRILGHSSAWFSLYEQKLAVKASMDMQSASSVVTDSSAASSSWGSGHRIINGMINIGVNGEEYTPILQKFKKAGKKVGCVTTVPITHATPAGFCTNSKQRKAQPKIAENYLDLRFDVMLGGGDKYFNREKRSDKRDMYAEFVAKGYTVVKNTSQMNTAPKDIPLLGVFDNDGLPYTVDENSTTKNATIPSLAQMTQKAIEMMSDHKKGFVLQVEGGKVDWAAHGNDIGALLFDQLAFDDAIRVAIDFAKKDGNTLVVITSDHGNANPGLIYGKECNKNFDNLAHFRHSNDFTLQSINPTDSLSQVRELLSYNLGNIPFTQDQAKEILSYYTEGKQEDGLYNYKKLPYRLLAEMQKKYTSVGWISMDHSSDYTELAMYGPGSQNLPPFIENYKMHNFLLSAAEVDLLEKY
ncbi:MULTISPECIES: alkaline phosphatase [unclassified Capnocytophaga]|uniref:alkaline phosphatase n=1 Tax=unclassified Capnocytophaga TaxID=2640652 RepID=UPI000202B30C|nr:MULTISPECIES: alkaline phosphatase [unclassified Capnocytophaga]EGD34059.1 alkaline phosphatase A [Capnocytophaga sp. oral taxon 338 str. F0234]MEB3004793.1 alkaline phosphatase [Capnocytophaga sp. G2]